MYKKSLIYQTHTQIANARRDCLTKVGVNFGGNSTIKRHGMAECCLLYRHTIPYQPNLPLLRSRFQRQPPNASQVCVCGMQLRKPRRCGRRNQRFRAGTPLVSLWRWRVQCLNEARTHRRGEAIRLPSRRNPPTWLLSLSKY